MKEIIPKGFNAFLLLLTVSVIVNYLIPVLFLRDLWFFFLLVRYANSKDEVFWVAVMLALNDGFFGFFGIRGVEFRTFGIPDFEISHLYLMILVFKVHFMARKVSVFYSGWIIAIYIYTAFLIFWGFSHGTPSDYNIYARTLRIVFPVLLLYYLPFVITTVEQYRRLFAFIFIMAVFAFVAQVLSVLFGASPTVLLGVSAGVIREEYWRTFYNGGANLLTFFAAMFYLSSPVRSFPRLYLILLMIAVYSTAFMSATRGWIISFSFIAFLYLIFIKRLNLTQVVYFLVVAFLAVQIMLLNPRIRTQFKAAIERTATLELLVQGDETAGGTLGRLDRRGPQVLNEWKKSPIVGWGFSDTFYEFRDGHVGNQNILLNSGIAGMLLLFLFYLFFHLRLFSLSGLSMVQDYYKKAILIFPIYFSGLFLLHSSSAQLFGYDAYYSSTFQLSIYFGFGAAVYRHIKQQNYA